MPEIGDYVLVHNIKHVKGTTMDGEPLPVWARIDHLFSGGDDEFNWNATLCRAGCEGGWGIDDDDLVPEDQVTDEQWAELVKWRLTDATDPA